MRVAAVQESGIRAQIELHPHDVRAWYLGAHAHHGLGDSKEALRWLERSLALAHDDPGTLYSAACLFSLLGETDRCFEAFERALDQGFSNWAWLENDPDLNPIRTDRRYAKLLEQLRG